MANLNYNRVILAGRITKDIEKKTTQSGVSVCTFSVAVNRKGKQGEEQQVDFHNCTAWRQTADFVATYFRKGSSILVEGALQNRSWEDQNGQKRYTTEIVVDNVYFVDAKNEMPGQNAAGATYSPVGQPNAVQANTYIPQDYVATQAPTEVLGDGEELPF